MSGFRRLNQAGFSLVEVLIAAGISTMVLAGAGVFMSQTAEIHQRDNLQNTVDTLFLMAMQNARNSATMYRKLLSTPDAAGINLCLTGKGTGCAQYTNSPTGPLNAAHEPILPGVFGQDDYNAYFGTNGRCSTASTPNPRCRIKIETTYRWICGPTSCTGLRLHVKVDPLDFNKDGTAVPSKLVKPREGHYSLPRESFNSKANIAFNCSTGPVDKLDYAAFKAQCADIPLERNCASPANTYGQSDANCLQQQKKDCLQNGFAILGLYADQSGCIDGGIPAYTGSTESTNSTPPPAEPTPERTCRTESETIGFGIGSRNDTWGMWACHASCWQAFDLNTRCQGVPTCYQSRGWSYCTACLKDREVCE